MARCLPMWGLAACACDTPVWQYALQMWSADAYEVVTVHRGGEGTTSVLDTLRTAVGNGAANLVVREADLNSGPGPYAELLAEHPPLRLPWMVVRFPVRHESRRTAWAGPADAATATRWLSSPMRREIAQLLLAGRTGVWLFRESGDTRKDEAAYRLLAHELARLERTLHLPAAAAGHAVISFAMARLLPDDPAERELETLLLASEPDLAARAHEPMLFPIYGRGMILYALVGAGINEATIAEAAEFLTGECSCEIKSQNPGMELLLTANWEAVVPGSVGLAGFLERGERVETALAGNVRDILPSPRTPVGNAEGAGTATAPCIPCPLVGALRRRPLTVFLVVVAVGVGWTGMRRFGRGRRKG